MSASNELLVEQIRSLTERLIDAPEHEKLLLKKQISELNQRLEDSTRTLNESKTLLKG